MQGDGSDMDQYSQKNEYYPPQREQTGPDSVSEMLRKRQMQKMRQESNPSQNNQSYQSYNN